MAAHKLQYQLHRPDGQHSHTDRFRYYLSFHSAMPRRSGPLHFNDAMTWCILTWGWSAEVNQAGKIMAWTQNINSLRASVPALPLASRNPRRSWSNIISLDLRIYLQSDAELTFFQLAHAVDQ